MKKKLLLEKLSNICTGSNLIVMAMVICSALTGIVSQSILSIFIVLLCFVLLVLDKLYLAYPFILFYNEYYGLVFGLSVQRIFSMIVLVLFAAKIIREHTIRVSKRIFIPLLVYVLYSMIVITQYSMSDAIFTVVDVITCLVLISFYLYKNTENLKSFFRVYVAVCLVAILTGILSSNFYLQGTMERFRATFEDPNYMGFFYTVPIFAMVSLRLFKPVIRWILVVVFYGAIMASVSMTAVVVNIVLWLIYLFLIKKISWKTILISLIVIFVVQFLYGYGIENPNVPILGTVCERIDEKLGNLIQGDMSAITTGRTDMTEEHLQYFWSLPIINLLFGGVPVNTSYIAPMFRSVAHNEYIDMLLNVGMVGTFILLGYLITKVFKNYKKYRQTGEAYHLCLLMLNGIWIFYGLSLTMFIDEKFMFMYFI